MISKILSFFSKKSYQNHLEKNLESYCNCEIKIILDIENILKHEIIDYLYTVRRDNLSLTLPELKKSKTFKQEKIKEIEEDIKQSKKEWIESLLNSSLKKNPSGKEEIIFNIKNDILWKNKEIDYKDYIYHTIFIPYNSQEYKRKGLIGHINTGITIRLTLVNGFIKLQVGNFSKELSRDVFEEGGKKIHQSFYTITEFPLVYFSYEHKIPVNYLNLSWYATNAYIKTLKNQKVEYDNDWRIINQDINDYIYVCDLSITTEKEDSFINQEDKQWKNIIKNFKEKKQTSLNIQAFKEQEKSEDSPYYYFDENGNSSNANLYYSNSYLKIIVTDYNSVKKENEEHLYSDYTGE